MGALKGTPGSVLVPKSHCLPLKTILPPNPTLQTLPDTALVVSLLEDRNNKPTRPVFPRPHALVWQARPHASLTKEEGSVPIGLCPSPGAFETHTLKPWVTSASVLTVLP